MHARFRKAVEFAVENSLLMVLGTLIALIWTNLHAASYDRAVHALHFAVNDIGMVFFFGLAVKEIIEATAPGGAPGWRSPKRLSWRRTTAASGPRALPEKVSRVTSFRSPHAVAGAAASTATTHSRRARRILKGMMQHGGRLRAVRL